MAFAGEVPPRPLLEVSMSRSQVPKYRFHKSSGCGFVQHRSIDTNDNRLSLGKYNTPESLRRYRQFLKRLELYNEGQEKLRIGSVPKNLELVVAYNEYAKEHYKRVDAFGNQFIAREYRDMRSALRIVLELHGDDLAHEFGPRNLKAIQRWMVREKYARSHINHTIGRIKRFYRWACSEELIPPETYHKLTCVRGLQSGELGAKEPKPIKPACPESLEKVLKYLPPVVGDMAKVQYFCGMRPGEVCIMRGVDIDRAGQVWWYSPISHKSRWRGKQLIKPIPRIAQEILLNYLKQPDKEYLFDPSLASDWANENRPKRKTKIYPCEIRRVNRKKRLSTRRKGKRRPGKHYTTNSYRRAVSKGFDRAEAAGETIKRFSPNQLRHAISTFVSQEVSAQAAQRWAGHENLETTSIYIEKQKSELVQIEKALHEHWVGA